MTYARLIFLALLMACGFVWAPPVYGQDSANVSLGDCTGLMGKEYISDGQDYKARLNKNNMARFHTVFYGGNRYCLVACSNIEDHRLIMKVYDSERNLLFDNTRHHHTPLWHLEFNSTVPCVVEIKVEAEQHIDRLVKLMIGFRKPDQTRQMPEQ